MNSDNLLKTTTRRKKRVGRGYGSGKGGHTATRGNKGQRARGKLKVWFEGGQLALIRRLPKTRGKGRFKPLKPSPVILNLKDLSVFKKGDEVTISTLAKAGVIQEVEGKKYGVKILGDGDIKTSLKVRVPMSKRASEMVKKAGGKAE